MSDSNGIVKYQDVFFYFEKPVVNWSEPMAYNFNVSTSISRVKNVVIYYFVHGTHFETGLP